MPRPATSPRPGGRRGTALADLLAGTTVALILVPQAIAYGAIAGVPPEAALRAAAVAPLAAALVAASPYLQTGPVALTSLLTFGALAPLAAPGSERWVALAAVLALGVGIVRVAVGLGRLGSIVAYLMSEPVTGGFVAAAAVLIAASQVPAALGVTGAEGTESAERALDALLRPGEWSLAAIVLAVVAAAVPLALRHAAPLVPGAAIVLVGGIAWSALGFPAGGTLGPIETGLPDVPDGIRAGDVGSLLLPAVVIALVGFAEAAAIARRFAAADRTAWDADREFVGQGIANIAAGAAGGLPVGGSFSRSALNRMAGARTRLSGAVAGAAVLVFLPFAGVLSRLPVAILAGVVIGSVVALLDPRPVARLLRLSRPQFGLAAATFAITLLASPNVERGVVAGVALSVLLHLWRELRLVVEAREAPGGGLVLRTSGVLWFGNAHRLQDAYLAALAAHPDARAVVVDLGGVGRIDLTAALVLRRMVDDGRRAGVATSIGLVSPAARRLVDRVVVRRSSP